MSGNIKIVLIYYTPVVNLIFFFVVYLMSSFLLLNVLLQINNFFSFFIFHHLFIYLFIFFPQQWDNNQNKANRIFVLFLYTDCFFFRFNKANISNFSNWYTFGGYSELFEERSSSSSSNHLLWDTVSTNLQFAAH